MSQRGRSRARTGAVRTGLSESVWRTLQEDWATDEEDEASDKEELHGEDVDWIDNGDDDEESNNDNEEDNPQRNVWILGTGNPSTVGNDLDEVEDHNDQQPRRRIRRSQRAIKTLADALDPQNYNMMELPTEAERKEVTGILEKKKKGQSVEIKFKNWKRTNRGRNPK